MRHHLLKNPVFVRHVTNRAGDIFPRDENRPVLSQGVDVTVNDKRMVSHEHGIPAKRGDFALESVGHYFVDVIEQRFFVFEEHFMVFVGGGSEGLRPEGADIDLRGLGDVDERRKAPE